MEENDKKKKKMGRDGRRGLNQKEREESCKGGIFVQKNTPTIFGPIFFPVSSLIWGGNILVISEGTFQSFTNFLS